MFLSKSLKKFIVVASVFFATLRGVPMLLYRQAGKDDNTYLQRINGRKRRFNVVDALRLTKHGKTIFIRRSQVKDDEGKKAIPVSNLELMVRKKLRL